MEKTKPFMIRGVAAFPKLNAPYSYDKEKKRSVVDYEKGQFSVDVIVEGADAEKIKALIAEAGSKVGVKRMANPPWTEEIDKATDEPTGRVRFKCKAYGTRRDGTPAKIQHFDANARPMASDTRLTSGSEIRVEVYPRAFKELGGGCRLNINAVQVLMLAAAAGPNPFSADPEFASDEPVSAFEAEDTGAGEVAPDADTSLDF